MSVDSKIPEIRFEVFSGEWEEKVLGELAEIVRGASPRPIEDPKWFDSQSSVGWLRIRDVTEQDGRIHYLEQRISKLGQEKTRVLHEKHLLLSIAASVGKPVVNYVETGVHDGFLIFKKPLFELEFMYQWLKSFEAKWQQFGQPGSQVNLNSDIVKSQVVAIPTNEEQTTIGNYFQKLDTLINQHQQKYGKLNNIKKAMLEKMFPKKGEAIPEIRFKGFNGEWVERSWSDTVDISTNMVDPRNCQYGELFHVGPGNIESFTGRFYNNVLKVKDSNLISGKFHFNKGDIIYGKINPQLAKYVIAPFEGLASADAYVLNTKNGVVQNYLFAILHTEDFYKYTVSVSSRTGMPKINRDELNIYSYMAPSESEQTQIGNYFQKLDALINQHQQQITKLNNIKQACLSKMFV